MTIPTPRVEQLARCLTEGHPHIGLTANAARELLAEYGALDTARAHAVAELALANGRAVRVADAVTTLCVAVERAVVTLDWLTAATILEAVSLVRQRLEVTG